MTQDFYKQIESILQEAKDKIRNKQKAQLTTNQQPIDIAKNIQAGERALFHLQNTIDDLDNFTD